MIRKIIYGIYAIIGMMVVTACSSRPDVYEISLEKMQGFPTEDAGFLKGVSALYAGVIDVIFPIHRRPMAGKKSFTQMYI